MKRLVLYVHHDPKGDVRDYILYCLKGLKEVVDDILFIVNGQITPKARHDVEALGVQILVRENEGFDWGAWKAGLEYYGYDKIAEYDELLLTNNTYYGPIYPFSEMWTEMDKRDCDFWGIAKHPKTDMLWIENDPKSVMLEHIQSYWLVFKKRVLKSADFKNYWAGVTQHHSFEEMVGYGETKLTDYFYRHGYSYDTYLNFEKYSQLCYDNPTFLTYKAVKEDRCPIAKRKYFYDPNFRNFDFNNHEMSGPKKLLEFLSKEELYDVRMIIKDLVQNAPMSQIADRIGLNYVFPVNESPLSIKDCHLKTAVIMYIYPMDLIDYCYQYAKNVPEQINIIIVNTSKAVQKACQNVFGQLKNKVEYRLQQNRGRDNTALLVTCRDVIEQYDVICFVHSKKSPYFLHGIIGEYFRNHNFDSLLYSKEYIENVLDKFSKNIDLGLCVPFIPTSSHYKNLLDNKWGVNWQNAKSVLQEKFDLDISPDKNVMGPWGGMFWCRTKALKTLSSYPWAFEDFPEEPLEKSDGLLTHALERLMSTLAQHDGYLTAWISPIPLAEEALGNLYYLYRHVRAEKQIVVQNSSSVEILTPKDFCDFRKNKRRLWKYKLLSKITFGKMRKKYKKKRKALKFKLKLIKSILKK